MISKARAPLLKNESVCAMILGLPMGNKCHVSNGGDSTE